MAKTPWGKFSGRLRQQPPEPGKGRREGGRVRFTHSPLRGPPHRPAGRTSTRGAPPHGTPAPRTAAGQRQARLTPPAHPRSPHRRPHSRQPPPRDTPRAPAPPGGRQRLCLWVPPQAGDGHRLPASRDPPPPRGFPRRSRDTRPALDSSPPRCASPLRSRDGAEAPAAERCRPTNRPRCSALTAAAWDGDLPADRVRAAEVAERCRHPARCPRTLPCAPGGAGDAAAHAPQAAARAGRQGPRAEGGREAGRAPGQRAATGSASFPRFPSPARGPQGRLAFRAGLGPAPSPVQGDPSRHPRGDLPSAVAPSPKDPVNGREGGLGGSCFIAARSKRPPRVSSPKVYLSLFVHISAAFLVAGDYSPHFRHAN